MKTVLNVLKEKLNTLGYNDAISNSVLNKLDIALIENSVENIESINDFIKVEQYDEPNIEIIRMMLNINNDMIQCEVLEGDIHISATESAIGTRFATADYTLSTRNAIIGVTSDFKIRIILYNPTTKIQNLYNGLTYEQAFKKERDEVTLAYYEPFLENALKNGKATERRVREVFTLLVSDFVIDEIAIKDLNPRFKIYDNEYKYAENLYSYSIRYINIRTNRIEFIEKDANIKICSKNVQVGCISNDPYIKIDKQLPDVDFPLNTVSYYWVNASKGIPEQLAVFLSPKVYEQAMFSELKKQDPRLETLARDITRRFKKETEQDIDYEDIKDVLHKLNFELMFPSVEIIRANMTNKTDQIEPIKYKYKIVTDPAEFEEKLYIAIEDHMARRYKYRLVENVLEDLTTIGNKLEYTDEKGQLVRKQSVADFNVNSTAVVIRRETFIDQDGIPDLLGYIYADMKYYGTDGLPVPNIEVVFYMPPADIDKSRVVMYNGTSLDFSIDNISKQNLFNSEQGNASSSYVIGGGAVLPGSTNVTVRYVNSKGEILKENIIGNVFPKTSFLPDAIPIINDKEGKEWVLENTNVLPTVLSADASANVVELKYIEKYARVHLSFINREGKKIAEDKTEIVQVGTNYDFDSKQICKDAQSEEWKLINARPSKLVVGEFEDKNKIILIYDIERADVVVNYVNKSGVKIAESKILQSAVDKVYKAEVIPYIVDLSGLGWNYIEGSNCTVLVKRDVQNEITLVYEEAKRKVVTRIRNLENTSLVDDEVVFVQIGKRYNVKFERAIIDFECKEWIHSKTISEEIIVSDDETKNVLEAIYEPKLSRVSIKFVSVDGRPIKEAMFKQAQVGARFSAEGVREIADNFGKFWALKEQGRGIVISENDIENAITLTYEPLMAKVTIKYFDAESNQLIDPKYETLQVGTKYKNKPMLKITDGTGKRWIVDESKIPEITVKKQMEENIVSVYYDKENTGVTLLFYDAYANKLKEPQIVQAQIGANFDTNLYLKITDTQGARWMLESSEPKNLMVRENGNEFKLIYGEVKAKVLVKHLDVNTQKAIIEDVITTVKLGGIFVPNIMQKVLDKRKYQWKYIGDENISIVTKENEQENIIILNYDEDKADVILKCQTSKGDPIRNDLVKQVQIGKELKVEPILKLNDSNGLGWKYTNSSCDTKLIKSEDNVIINYYEPLKAKIHTKYLGDDAKELVAYHEDIIQVGKKFTPNILEKVTDSGEAVWKFVNVSEKEIIVKDDINVIECNYEKLMSQITINYLDEQNNHIAETQRAERQVGTVIETKVENSYTDKNERAWILSNIDNKKIKIQEDSDKNIVNIYYKKELVDVKLCFFNPALQTIRAPLTVKVQIGSVYKAKPDKVIFDDKSLGWDLREDLIPEFKVKRNAAENIINISYDKYLVDAIVQFVDEENNHVIEPIVTKHQVGTTFMPEIKDYIEDKSGKEWVYALKVANKIFTTTQKVEPIVVNESSGKNIIKLFYKPSMSKVIIKYKDPMGTDIRMQTETEAQIGSEFTPEILDKIVAAGNIKWVYNPNSKATIKVSKDSTKNVINLAYEEQKAAVIYIYKDEHNNILREEKKQLAQIGSTHRPNPENVVESKDGRVWEYKAKNFDEIKVDDDEKNNIVEIIYAPLKVNVTLKFLTLNGNVIMPSKTVKAQLGSEFKAPADQTITDEESKLYRLIKVEPQTIKVKEIPLNADASSINVFELTYESSYSETRIIFKDIDGNKLREDEIKQMHVGTMFAPKPIQYITDRNGIQWELISDKIDPVRVMEDVRQNQITMVYEVAKAEISVRFKDTDGNTIKEAKLYNLEIGKEFIPEVEHEIEDDQKRKWTYVMTDPIKLTVGSINNIVNVVYQEKKVMTIVKVQTTDGQSLRDDLRLKLQVGSKYIPTPVTKVIYDNSNNIWRFAYNNPSEIIVSENVDENVIIQYFTTDGKIRNDNENKTFKPDISKFIDEDLVAQAAKEEEEKQKLKEAEEAAKKQAEIPPEEVVTFTDQYLIALERSMTLTNAEKGVINTLNNYNTDIMMLLHEALEHIKDFDEFDLKGKLEKITREEKQLIESGLSTLISENKTGSRLLRIFESIVASEMNDKEFSFLQTKKEVTLAEYFVYTNVTEREEVDYIINRGKINKGLEIVNKKINEMKIRLEELNKIRVILTYESVMLDHYERARSLVKDQYFIDPDSKSKMSKEVIIKVANDLPNQAIKLFKVTLNMSIAQRNELEAIMALLTPPQYTTVTSAINMFTDGKLRKNALKLFKEITEGGKR